MARKSVKPRLAFTVNRVIRALAAQSTGNLLPILRLSLRVEKAKRQQFTAHTSNSHRRTH